MEDIQSFDTTEAVLALCLILAGGEPLDERQPAINLFDADILFTLGGGQKNEDGAVIRPSRFAGMGDLEAAKIAWKEGARGHVRYIIKLTPRLADLIRAYREQCKDIEAFDGKSGELIQKIITHAGAGAIQQDEMILRISCVILKTRGRFVNVWKKMIPHLRIPDSGRVKHFDTTVVSRGKMVEAKGVERPGFKLISLNASEETKRHLGL